MGPHCSDGGGEVSNFNPLIRGCVAAGAERFGPNRLTTPGCVVIDPHRSALLTPYVPRVSQALIDSLNNDGYAVAQVGSFNESRDDRVARIASHSLIQALDALASEGHVDAIVASCTNLRTYGLLQQATERLAVPVISSNSALTWHIQALLRATG